MGKFGRFFECSLIYNYVLYQRKNCHREPLLKLHVHVFFKKGREWVHESTLHSLKETGFNHSSFLPLYIFKYLSRLRKLKPK